MTAYDWLLARRTLALGLLLSALVFLVMLGTDEPGSVLSGRLARLAALVAFAGGGAAFITTEQAKSRGEMRAFAAAGRHPTKAVAGAVLGGATVGALGPALLIFGRPDLRQLFPRLALTGGASHWSARGGAWFDSARAILVGADGQLSFVGPSGPSSSAPGSLDAPRVAVLSALAVAALGFPVWATASGPPRRRAGVVLAAAAASVVVFHLVAADRAPSVALILPPALVLLDAWALHRRAAW